MRVRKSINGGIGVSTGPEEDPTKKCDVTRLSNSSWLSEKDDKFCDEEISSDSNSANGIPSFNDAQNWVPTAVLSERNLNSNTKSFRDVLKRAESCKASKKNRKNSASVPDMGEFVAEKGTEWFFGNGSSPTKVN